MFVENVDSSRAWKEENRQLSSVEAEPMYERQGVAGVLLHLAHSVADIGLHRAGRHHEEPVRARILARQRGAHPRQGVGHPRRHLRPDRPLQPLELRDRVPRPLGSVVQLLRAVAQGAPLGAGGAAAERCDVESGGPKPGEGEVGGDVGELDGALPDLVGVAGEGRVAEARVQGGGAALAYEFRGVASGARRFLA